MISFLIKFDQNSLGNPFNEILFIGEFLPEFSEWSLYLKNVFLARKAPLCGNAALNDPRERSERFTGKSAYGSEGESLEFIKAKTR